MKLLRILQCTFFLADTILFELLSIVVGPSWLSDFIGLPLLIISIILKIVLLKRQSQLKYILKVQQSFIIPYVFVFLVLYFMIHSSIIINEQLESGIIFSAIRILLQYFMYSLTCNPIKIDKWEYRTFALTLVFQVFFFGVVTVLGIQIGNTFQAELLKDLLILQTTTFIALSLFVLDILQRNLKYAESNQQEQEKKTQELEMPIINQ